MADEDKEKAEKVAAAKKRVCGLSHVMSIHVCGAHCDVELHVDTTSYMSPRGRKIHKLTCRF
jgi:hypothetical protein